MIARPDVLLRLESWVVLWGRVGGVRQVLHGHWGFFAALFLVPDFSLAGYLLRDKRVAAWLYNAIHSYLLPILLVLVACHRTDVRLEQIAAIWISHIAFDRLLGFGLKYREAFQPTHIQSAAFYRAAQ
jgi:hypothetical protein